MRAVQIDRYGGPEVLRVRDVPEPTCGPDDVRVRVRAASINPVDFKIRGGYQRAVVRPRLPATLGMDVSGEVLEVGARVRGLRAGDEVFSSPSHRRMGCYAEQVVVRADELAKKPATIDHEQAASLPLVGLTAWDALVGSCALEPGQRVLVQAGSGGVGTFAIQLAKHLGAEVLTTCSERNHELVRDLGADVAIDYRRERYEDVARGVDAVLESMGGEHVERALSTVRRGGRVALITAGLPDYTKRYGAYLGVGALALSLAWRMGVARLRYGARLRMVTRRPDGENLAKLAALVDDGAIRPVVDRVFALEDAAEAHRYLETGRARGKVVLAVA